MRKAAFVCAVGVFLLGMTWGLPAALGKTKPGGGHGGGGITIKAQIWFYETGIDTLFKSNFTKDSKGVVTEQRLFPQKMTITFTPISLPKPPGAQAKTWYFSPPVYTVVYSSIGGMDSTAPYKPLDQFFAVYGEYWLQVTTR